MFFLNTKPKPQPSELERAREKQIVSLLSLNPAAKAVNAERSEFDIPIYLRDRTVTLKVFLRPQFPQEPPALQLRENARHSWLDQNNFVVNHPKIQQWSPHNDVGRLVKDTIDEFLIRPPAFLNPPGLPSQSTPSPYPPPAQPAISSYPPAPTQPLQPGRYPSAHPGTIGVNTAHPAYSQPTYPPSSLGPSLSTGVPAPMQATPTPAASPAPASGSVVGTSTSVQTQKLKVPSTFPELEQKSSPELEALLEDPSLLQEFAFKLPCIQDPKQLLNDMEKDNYETAKKNLEMENVIRGLETEIESIRHTLDDMKTKFDTGVAKQREFSERLAPDVLIAKMTSLIDLADGESESLGQSLVTSSKISNTDIQDYIAKRKIYYLRLGKKQQFR